MRLFVECYFILIFLLNILQCEKYDVYTELRNFYPCVYYSTDNGGYGCQSSIYGNRGRLHVINSDKELKNPHTQNQGEAKVLMLSQHYFTPEIIRNLEKQYNVKGIILETATELQKNRTVNSFSPARKCPGELLFNGNDTCAGHHWNPNGNSLFYKNFNYPIFLIEDESTHKIIQKCYESNFLSSKNITSNCGVEMNSFMFSHGQNVSVCFRRNAHKLLEDYFCSEMKDNAYFGTLGDFHTGFKDTTELVVLSANIDGRSMFYHSTLNAQTSVSGLIPLLAIVHQLGEWKRENPDLIKKMKKNILFLLNNGNSFDLLGSESVVFSMNKKEVPAEKELKRLLLSNITSFIDFNQLGAIQNPNHPIYFHFNNESSDVLNVVQTYLKKYFSVKNATFSTSKNREMPPSTFSAFYNYRSAIDGLVLADFDTQYNNKYYSSNFDDALNLNITFTYNGNMSNVNITNAYEKLVYSTSKAALSLAGVPDDAINELTMTNNSPVFFY